MLNNILFFYLFYFVFMNGWCYFLLLYASPSATVRIYISNTIMMRNVMRVISSCISMFEYFKNLLKSYKFQFSLPEIKYAVRSYCGACTAVNINYYYCCYEFVAEDAAFVSVCVCPTHYVWFNYNSVNCVALCHAVFCLSFFFHSFDLWWRQ